MGAENGLYDYLPIYDNSARRKKVTHPSHSNDNYAVGMSHADASSVYLRNLGSRWLLALEVYLGKQGGVRWRNERS